MFSMAVKLNVAPLRAAIKKASAAGRELDPSADSDKWKCVLHREYVQGLQVKLEKLVARIAVVIEKEILPVDDSVSRNAWSCVPTVSL